MFRIILLFFFLCILFFFIIVSINLNYWISGKMGVLFLICFVDVKYVVFGVSRFEFSKLKFKVFGCCSMI